MLTNIRIEELYSAKLISERVDELAKEIADEWPKEITIVGLLRGSFIFAADLVRALNHYGVAIRMDFLTLSSYGNALKSSGQVELKQDMQDAVAGKDILIIDDILETGNTLHAAMELLKARGAKSVKAAVLLEKPDKLEKAVSASWVGFSVPDKFVVGYGLDYKNYYRDLPYIGVLCQD